MWKYLLLWIPMVFIAIANGVVREAWYGRHLSELRAHQLSTLTGVVLFGLYIWDSPAVFPAGLSRSGPDYRFAVAGSHRGL